MQKIQKILGDSQATIRLGAALAARATAGDIIGLSGDLGVGKTTLARGFIQAATGDDADVPSPTFTLVQVYAGHGMTICHADLYRIASESEIEELGLEQADSGLILIEWPERIPYLLRRAGLHVRLDFSGHGRVADISMTDTWRTRLHDLPEPV